MKKDKDVPATCLRCDLPITGAHELKHAVRLSNGYMHGTCHADQNRAVAKLIAAAVAAGSHSLTVRTWCDIGRHVFEGGAVHGTFDGKSACRPCAERIGVKFDPPQPTGARR